MAVFRQSMQKYERMTRIQFHSRMQISELDFGDYEKYPAHLHCGVKLLADGMRHFPSSIELVTFRVRGHNVKVETGDEEAVAEFMTKFNFFVEEFQNYDRTEDVSVTFSLRLFKQILSAWDKRSQDIHSYFKERSGIVFVIQCPGFTTRVMTACVVKNYPPNSPIRTGDETLQSTNITYK